MYPLSIRSICVIAAVLMAGSASPASSQTAPAQTATPQVTPDAKARCKQLIDYFDRFGSSRGEDHDGARNMTRMGAGIDCNNGHAEEGVHAMEDLLARKHYPVPPATGLAHSP
jgi:hypothetical protein